MSSIKINVSTLKMRVINKRRSEKQFLIGRRGIYDSVSNLLKRMATSNVANALANVAQIGLCKKAVEASKTVAKEIELKAIDVKKDFAIAKVNTLINKVIAPKPALTQEFKETAMAKVDTLIDKFAASRLVRAQKSKDIVSLSATLGPLNVIDLLEGSATLSFQELARRLNGGDLKAT